MCDLCVVANDLCHFHLLLDQNKESEDWYFIALRDTATESRGAKDIILTKLT